MLFKNVAKILNYIISQEYLFVNHPLWTMEENGMLTFLWAVLQVGVEYSNSHSPPSEYVLDFPKGIPTIWNFILQCDLWLHNLCRWWYLWIITKILLWRKVFFVMYYEAEAWPMLHSAVKCRQNMCIYHKWICKARFHMHARNDHRYCVSTQINQVLHLHFK